MSYIIFATSPGFLQFPNYKQLLSHHSVLSPGTDFEASGFSPGMLAGRKLHYLLQFLLMVCFSISSECTQFSLSACFPSFLYVFAQLRLSSRFDDLLIIVQSGWLGTVFLRARGGGEKLLFAEFMACQAWLNQQNNQAHFGPDIIENTLWTVIPLTLLFASFLCCFVAA